MRAQPIVFDPVYPSAIRWTVPFCLMAIGVGIGSSWGSYADGTWLLDPMMAVMCPLIGLLGCGIVAYAWPKMVKRIHLHEDRMVVERFRGRTMILPYSGIIDVSGERIRTRHGKLVIGQKNSNDFHRMIRPYLKSSQRPDIPIEEIARAYSLLIPMLLAPVLLSVGIAWHYGLNESQMLSVTILLLIPSGFTAWIAARVLGRRDREQFEREFRLP